MAHHHFRIGAAVIVLESWCSDCSSNTGPLPGTVVACASKADGAAIASSDGLEPPYYFVDLDHEHAAGAVVMAQCELEAAEIYDLDRRNYWAFTVGDTATEVATRRAMQRLGLAAGCVHCGAVLIDAAGAAHVGGVSKWPAGWLCERCAGAHG